MSKPTLRQTLTAISEDPTAGLDLTHRPYPFPSIVRWHSSREGARIYGMGTLGTEPDLSRTTRWLTSLGHTVLDVVEATPENVAALCWITDEA